MNVKYLQTRRALVEVNLNPDKPQEAQANTPTLAWASCG